MKHSNKGDMITKPVAIYIDIRINSEQQQLKNQTTLVLAATTLPKLKS